MRITYDPSCDAMYIYLCKDKTSRSGGKTVSTEPLRLDGHMINLDFDEDKKLFGIEIIDASEVLEDVNALRKLKFETL